MIGSADGGESTTRHPSGCVPPSLTYNSVRTLFHDYPRRAPYPREASAAVGPVPAGPLVLRFCQPLSCDPPRKRPLLCWVGRSKHGISRLWETTGKMPPKLRVFDHPEWIQFTSKSPHLSFVLGCSLHPSPLHSLGVPHETPTKPSDYSRVLTEPNSVPLGGKGSFQAV